MTKKHHDQETDDQPKPVSRRELLERTGVALGLLATTGCVEGSDGDDPASQSASPQGSSDPSDPKAPGMDRSEAAGPSTDDSMSGSADPMPQAGSGPGPADDPGMMGGGDQPAPADDPEEMGDPDRPSDPDPGDGSGEQPANDPGDEGMTAEPGEDSTAADPDPVSGVPVAIVRRDDVEEAVARAITLAGGLDEIQEGQTVFIKPNAVSNRGLTTPGIRTSNEVLAAVVRLVKERNPGRIIVGDRSARGFDSGQVFDTTGMGDAAMMAGADEIYAAPEASREDDHWVLVRPPNYEEVWPSGLLVMRKAIDADHLVNVPTCKNHRFAMFTMSMKNFVGGIGDSSRGPLHYLDSIGGDFEALGRDIALLNQAFSPLINVVDATTVVVNGGPQGDGADTVRVSAGLILASKDRIALDTACVSLVQHELGRVDVPSPDGAHNDLKSQRVWEMPQIKNGIELGIGVGGVDEASLVFDQVDEADAMASEAIWRA